MAEVETARELPDELSPGPGRGPFARFSWFDPPAGGIAVIFLLLAIFAAPAWLLADELRYPKLWIDDFVYVNESRTWSLTLANLTTPRNTHIVPLFRLLTFALVAAAGCLANLPFVLCSAAYLGLIVTMGIVGLLVWKQTKRTALALIAMTLLGVTTAMETVITWYSAGQALWAGAFVAMALVFACEWCEKGGTWRFLLILLGVFAAPLFWTAGLVAGPAAAAYLWADGRKRSRLAALVLIAGAVVIGSVQMVLVRGVIEQTPMVLEERPELWPRPVQAVLHTAQAIVEVLIFANLGLDVLTTPAQAVCVTCTVAALWFYSRRTLRPRPLEAAGLTIVLLSYGIVYYFRGNFPFSSLRDLGWYHAIPQVGAVLFVLGWIEALTGSGKSEFDSGPQPPARTTRPFTRGEAVGVIALILLQVSMHQPRAERLLLAKAPPLTAKELELFPNQVLPPNFVRDRSHFFQQDAQGRQVRHLSRLDKAEVLASRLGVGATALRNVYGRIIMPGIPEQAVTLDVIQFMNLPADSGSLTPAQLHATFDTLLPSEPESTPPWLKSGS